MSEAPKFKTFRDLRSLPSKTEIKTADTSSTSRASRASSTSTAGNNNIVRANDITKNSEVSPTRDFQKIPNSVPRSLEMFRGKSKQVWDYLWHVSRGSINPIRKIRKSRKEIKDGAALGSMVTVDAAIEHLIDVGLLKVNQSIGSSGGNEYEIFTPEEVLSAALSSTSSTSSTSYTSLTQKVDILDILESSISSITQTTENKDTYGAPNTSLKTNTKNDDDSAGAFSEFIEKISAACKRITGKQTTKRESEKWGIFADLLILEFESAARQTDSISSAPAFLTEVLRRKLLGGLSSANQKNQKSKPDTVGKPDERTGDYEIKALDESERNEALEQLREFADSTFLIDFKRWYTEEDWNWISNELLKYKETPQADKKTD